LEFNIIVLVQVVKYRNMHATSNHSFTHVHWPVCYQKDA